MQGRLAANVWLLSAIACLTEYADALPVLFADRGRPLQQMTKVRRIWLASGERTPSGRTRAHARA